MTENQAAERRGTPWGLGVSCDGPCGVHFNRRMVAAMGGTPGCWLPG